MSFPKQITSGFNFNEAIAMAELSRRVYRVFEFEQDREIGELYNAIYNDDEWEFAHSMSDYETDGRVLIVKRKGKNQFAVVFRGTIVTSGGVELTGMEGNEDIRLVEYYRIPFEPTPPSRDVRVFEGMLTGFEAFREQLELFFNILVSPELDQNLLVDLLHPDDKKVVSLIETMVNAFSIRNNVDEATRVDMLTSMSKKINKFNERPLDSYKKIHIELNISIKSYFKINLIKIELEDDFNCLEVYFTGHSRGGALATFAVLHLKRYWESKGRKNFLIKKYSVGSPKIGNKSFVHYYNKNMDGFSYRVQNLMDAAIYFPTPLVVPFPYNLQLMIPGIDYVREGDVYYAYYEHVGEAYTLFGLGHQKLNLNFGGPLNFTIPVPFPHGPDGYKKMLIEAHERQQKALMNFQHIFNVIFQKQRDAMLSLDQKISDIQESVNKLKNNN